MKKAALLLGSLSILLTGCAGMMGPIEKNLSEYKRAPMPNAKILPSKEEFRGGKTKVVVFNLDDSHVDLAKSAKAGYSFAKALEDKISITGAEIVDRSIAQKLRQEIELAEMKGGSGYAGPNVASFAVTGEVSAANVGAEYSKAERWQDKKGKWHQRSASCRYSAQAKANLRIYKMPELKLLSSITVDGDVSDSQETVGSSCPISKESQEGMVQQAAMDAIESFDVEIQNQFAPKAYVVEHRSNGDDSIFKLSQGSALGFKPESIVTIYRTEEVQNPITGETTVEEYPVVKAEVTDQVSQNYAWLALDDNEKASQIRLGHYAKVKYERSVLSSLGKMVDSAMSSGGLVTGK